MSNGTFTIPELRCQKHFYSSILVERQAQAPVNEGIVAVDPCEECLEALRRDNAALREALKEIYGHLGWFGSGPTTSNRERFRKHVNDLRETARAALRQADQGEK